MIKKKKIKKIKKINFQKKIKFAQIKKKEKTSIFNFSRNHI